MSPPYWGASASVLRPPPGGMLGGAWAWGGAGHLPQGSARCGKHCHRFHLYKEEGLGWEAGKTGELSEGVGF